MRFILYLLVYAYILFLIPLPGESVMNEYVWHSERELIAIAHLAAMERARREREEEAKRHVIELLQRVQLQPDDFVD